MEIYRGKVLHSGIAAGKIHILERGLHVEKKKAGDGSKPLSFCS